jgi:hypothetical protein
MNIFKKDWEIFSFWCRCLDISKAVNNGGIAALVLLDLPASFDTMDHDTQLLRLENRTRHWRSCPRTVSFVSDRSMFVVLNVLNYFAHEINRLLKKKVTVDCSQKP